MDKPPNIIFFGTPDFAVPALNAICRSRFNVSMVVTRPDRPKGRGRKMLPSPVKTAAKSLGYEVLQPESIKTESFYRTAADTNPDFLVAVAFGKLIPDRLLSLPKICPVNIHPSLLPRYRGPAPIQWALINGENETGVTIMTLDSGMDTGDILISEIEKIQPDDTSAALHDRLAETGASLLIQAIDGLLDGSITPSPQDSSKATYAPLLKKADGLIDWSLPSEKIEAFIRGMTPWPGAFTFFNEKRLKIFKVKQAVPAENAVPGTIIKGFQDELRVATGNGALSILEIQGASGKRLAIRDFLRGATIPEGTVLQLT